jgi:hypothetical protein
VPDADLTDLLRRSQFVFEATVAEQGRSTVAGIPVDDHTVVVRVDRVLQAPAALGRAAGSEVTVQLLDGSPVPAVGERTVLYTSAMAFGQGIAVTEVGRTEPGAPGEAITAAGAAATLTGARPGRPHPVLEAAQRLDDERLQAHADEADAVVVGRVVGLEKAGPSGRSEHDPDWWRATIQVSHAEKGDLSGQVQVLYPNSSDILWARIPKPRAGQEGLWLLHATSGDQADLGPFSLLDTDDAHPADHLDRLQRNGT